MRDIFTVVIACEDGGYVSFCPELDIASQGKSVPEARDNIREALELFFDCASPEELNRRLHISRDAVMRPAPDRISIAFHHPAIRSAQR